MKAYSLGFTTEYATFCRLVATHGDSTLAELCHLSAQATQTRLSTSSMHRTLAKLKLTREKRRFRGRNQKTPQSSSHVTPTGKPSSECDQYTWTAG